MARFSIEIYLDDAAFVGNDCGSEIARILQKTAMAVDGSSRGDLHDWSKRLLDINGNRVGKAEVSMEVDEIDPELWTEVHDVARLLGTTQKCFLMQEMGVPPEGMTDDEMVNAIAEAVVMGDMTVEDIEAATRETLA